MTNMVWDMLSVMDWPDASSLEQRGQIDHSAVPARTSVIQGCGRVCVTSAWFSGTDSCSCHLLIQRQAHIALQDVAVLSLGRFSQLEREGKPAVLGTLLLLGALGARKSINTVIALSAQISIFFKLNPPL